MRVFKSLNRRSSSYTKNSVLIIGNLDGVHKGHQSIINSAKKIANKKKSKIGVLLFDPHPRKYFNKNCKSFLLTALNERLEILKSYGINYAVIIKFNKKTPSQYC